MKYSNIDFNGKTVLITGGAGFIGSDEKDLEKEYKNLDVKIVKENLLDTIFLISNLDLLVGNDNGLMHIGYATNINTITIFGMTNEKETGGYRRNNKSVFLEMDCRPCFHTTISKAQCKDLNCLKKLELQQVEKAILEVLND